MAVSDGIGSYWGIPIFDATQGFGYRLPTQGSLGQSPFVFLRWFGSVELIQMVYLGAAIFLCSWTVGQYCREYQKQNLKLSVLILHVALLGPLILFTVVNEWQTTAAGFCSRVVLIIFAFYLMEKRIDGKEETLDPLMCISAASATFLTVVGHPGEWALVLPILIVVTLLLFQRWRKLHYLFPKLLLKTFVSPKILIIYCSTLVFVLSAIDLLLEAKRPVSSSARQVQRFGIEFFQLPKFASFQNYEWFVESVVAFVMSIVGPIVNLFFETSGRYEFIALSLLVLVAVDYIFRRRRLPKDHVYSLRVGLAMALLIIVQYAAELSGFVPGFMQSSGSYQHAPQLLFISVLLWLARRKHFERKLPSVADSKLIIKLARAGEHVAVVIAFVALVVQPFSLLKMTSPHGIRNYQQASKQTELNLVANFRNSDFYNIPDWSQSTRLFLAPGYVRAFEGFPVLENEPKLRNTSTLMRNPVFNQNVARLDLDSSDLSLFRDFASLLTLVNYDNSNFDSNDVSVGETTQLIDTGLKFNVTKTTRNEFHTFSIDDIDLVEGDSRCPLLEVPSCIQRISTYISNPRSTPRWRLGKGKVLATYDWEISPGAWGVVIPMDYDKAILVRDIESRKELETYSHYGLLVAKISDGKDSGTLQIFVDPDWRMRLRSFASYFSLVSFGLALLQIWFIKRNAIVFVRSQHM